MKYRVKQVGNKFYPQYKNSGLFSSWKFFYENLDYPYDKCLEVVVHESLESSKRFISSEISKKLEVDFQNKVIIHPYKNENYISNL